MKRDVKNQIIAGVCAGLGKYFKIDPVIVRFAFLFAFLAYGIGPLAYLILWIIMKPETE